LFDAARVGWRPPRTITQLFYPYSIRGDRYVCVEETGSIDAIDVDKQTREVILTVSAHLEWSDSLKHQTLLQAKLNAYFRFVESGEILERYPTAKQRRVAFCVVFKFAPDQEGQQFLAPVRQVVESAGIGFRYEVLAVSYGAE
jgi:hypothetical protein